MDVKRSLARFSHKWRLFGVRLRHQQEHKFISQLSLTDIALLSIAFDFIELVVFKQDDKTLDTVSIETEEDMI